MKTSPLELGYDPFSADFRRDPYPAYRRLQQQAPRFYDSNKHEWVISRYADVRFVLQDPRFQFADPNRTVRFDEATFRSIDALPPSTERFAQQRRKGNDLLDRFLEIRHPPEHTMLRQLIQPWFNSASLNELQSWQHAHAHALLDRIIADDTATFDIVQQFTIPFAYGTLCRLLGVDATEDRGWMIHPHRIIVSTDFIITQTDLERAAWAAYALALSFVDLMSKPSALRPGGLLEHLAKPETAQSFHEDERLALLIQLVSAGYETSANTLGLVIRTLLRHDAAWQQLRATPELLPDAIEEAMRFDGSIQARPHVALEDVDVGDWHIRRGDRFQLLIGAANRDPEQFERPDELVLDRSPNPHLNFLYGIHYCIGAPLGRQTLRVGLQALLGRVPNLRLVENGETWMPTYWMHAFEHLLVTR